MTNQCRAFLWRGGGTRRRWCGISPASGFVVECDRGHLARRDLCAEHVPVLDPRRPGNPAADGRPATGDLWICPDCRGEGNTEWQRSDDDQLGAHIRWRYQPDRGPGRWHEGRLIWTGRRPSRWQFGKQVQAGRPGRRSIPAAADCLSRSGGSRVAMPLPMSVTRARRNSLR